MLGVSNTYTMKGFERAPFTQRHQLKVGYYFATEGFDIAYNGDFANFISDWNLGINGFLTSESLPYNYFGLGNELKILIIKRALIILELEWPFKVYQMEYIKMDIWEIPMGSNLVLRVLM